MSDSDLAGQLLSAWRVHNEISLRLLEAIPPAGLKAVPTGSRGRDVARQFAHLARVRAGWLYYHKTGKRFRLPRDAKAPGKAALAKALRRTGKDVETFLDRALQGRAATRLFGKRPVRWMGYLISHESHHRGQILLALKQNGLRLPEKVALQGIWGRWIFGK
jgi:uncharacterized damage-inducible protein DinB